MDRPGRTAFAVSLGGVDRRAVGGVLLLVAALIAVLATPNILGRRIAGFASPEVIAGPPAVGSCVAAIAPPGSAVGPRAASPGTRALPVATIVPCRGPVIGEIISVTAQNTTGVSTLQEYDDTHPSCRNQVETYLGTAAATILLGVQWSKSIYVNAMAVGPDAHDRAAGRTWSACVMAAVGQSYTEPPTLRSSWTANTLPDAFGLCWAATIVQRGSPTPCTAAHRTQQLAFGYVPGPSDSQGSIVSAPTPADLAAGCQQLAATIMEVKDPTRGGALLVTVVSDRAGAPYRQCAVSVTGSRPLIGSVIGLGDGPLPLA